jgi:hypothetical protein
VSSRRHGAVYVRKNHTVSDYPEDLKTKVYLLKHFERYIMDRLYGDYEYTFEDTEKPKGMDFVQKYLRMKHVIVFKMSHDVLQVRLFLHLLRATLIQKCTYFVVQFLRPFKNYTLVPWTTSYPHRQELQDDAMDAQRNYGSGSESSRRRSRPGQVQPEIGRQAKVLQGGSGFYPKCECQPGIRRWQYQYQLGSGGNASGCQFEAVETVVAIRMHILYVTRCRGRSADGVRLSAQCSRGVSYTSP